MGPHARILPYIEQNNVYAGINPQALYGDLSNLPAVGRVIENFLCPSEVQREPQASPGRESGVRTCENPIVSPPRGDTEEMKGVAPHLRQGERRSVTRIAHRSNVLKPALVLVVACCAALGCRDRAIAPFVDPSYDAPRAKQTLVAALDAWRQGRARQLSPGPAPIRFVDEGLAAGWRLLSYEFEDPQVALQPFQDVVVKLTLKDATGATTIRSARYQVTLAPSPAVLRSDS